MQKITTALTIVILMTVASFAQPDTLWTKTFNSIEYQYAKEIQQTNDNGYIICGYIRYDAANSLFLLKTDYEGNEIWIRSYGDTLSSSCGYAVLETDDNGYIVVGNHNNETWMLRTNSGGDSLWSKYLGGSTGNSMKRTPSGGYIIAGYSYDSFDRIYLVETDENGDSLWSNSYGVDDYDYRGYGIDNTNDDGYIITGRSDYFQFIQGVALLKTDQQGNELWLQNFSGSGYSEKGNCVISTDDGGYIVVGNTNSFGAGSNDVYLLKTNSDGDTIWTQTYGDVDGDYGNDVIQTSENGYLIIGETEIDQISDVWLIKTDDFGNVLWTQTYGGESYDWGKSIKNTNDNGYIIAGGTQSFGGGDADVYLIRLDSEGTLVEDIGSNQPATFILHPCNPNPFNPSTTISFELRETGFISLDIFDLAGRSVGAQNFVPINKYMTAGNHSITFNAEGLTSGIYFARLTTENGQTQTQKLVLMK